MIKIYIDKVGGQFCVKFKISGQVFNAGAFNFKENAKFVKKQLKMSFQSINVSVE